MKTKEQLITEYRKIKMGDINGLNEVIKNLEIYSNENGLDAQLELVLHMACVRKLDCPGISRESIFKAAKPVIELLQTMGDSFFEIEAIATMLCFTESYELCTRLMKKALDALNTNLADHELREATTLIVFCNMSYRLLYSRFYDKEDPKDIEKLFDHCTKSGVALCEKKGAHRLVLRTILLARQAVFNEDFNGIFETLTALRELKDKGAFRGTQDDIAEFYHKMDKAPPTKVINLFMGHQIRTRREELGLSREEFGAKVNTDPNYLRMIERGTRGLSRTKLMTYVKALKVDFDYLFGNLSKQPADAITDPKIIKMNEATSPLSEEAKDHVLEYIRSFAKLYKNKS